MASLSAPVPRFSSPHHAHTDASWWDLIFASSTQTALRGRGFGDLIMVVSQEALSWCLLNERISILVQVYSCRLCPGLKKSKLMPSQREVQRACREHQARRRELVNPQNGDATRWTESSWEAREIQQAKTKAAWPGKQQASDKWADGSGIQHYSGLLKASRAQVPSLGAAAM